MSSVCEEHKFNNLSAKITQLFYSRTEGDRTHLNKSLAELNLINYKYPLGISPTKAALLVNQCCSLISPDDAELVVNCCKLITSLSKHQNIPIEGRTLTVSVQWCLAALNKCGNYEDILISLESLLRINNECSPDLISDVIRSKVAVLAKEDDIKESTLAAMQCLEACTCRVESHKKMISPAALEICFETFSKYLCNLFIVCLRGLQNVVIKNPDILHRNLGSILGIIKSYMLYNITGIEYIAAQKIMPSALSIPEPSSSMSREKKGGKITKQRKHRTQNVSKKDSKKSEEFDNLETIQPTFNNQTFPSTSSRISDSDVSDSETGKTNRIPALPNKVRQVALNLFFEVIKLTEKNVMFSYWSSFIPENSLSGKHNLAVCILKDPSTRGRVAALNVLLLLLTSAKLYLLQAESSDQNLAYTPYSVVIGLTINELHKCLILALNENSIPALTQVLKCFAALVQATPYHKLKSGIITRIIRNVKPFMYYKDSTVQITALIVLGCILASEPSVPETINMMLNMKIVNESAKKPTKTTDDDDDDDDEFDLAQYSDEDDQSHDTTKQLPWLLEKCLRNLGIATNDGGMVFDNTIAVPIKLESLQVLSAMSRNYFDILIAPYLTLITKALDVSLSDKYVDVRLHAGKTVDFIGQAMNKYFAIDDNRLVTIDCCLTFWNVLINNSLPALLQSEHPTLRAVGCDCFGSIGSYNFEHISREKQLLCVTLLFSCSRDMENSVKGAAVRALAICVLYPSLREDPGFVADTAEVIYRTLQDENISVKVKSSWSLGNLSDALVLNRLNTNIVEELPKKLLVNLIKCCLKIANDNDKIKMNIVRALGNLMQLATDEQLHEDEFRKEAKDAIDTLVKNCVSSSNMKVRWNSCYAIGNIVKNPALYRSSINWQQNVFGALMNLVVAFRNFKVRINAAFALSCPPAREFYADLYQTVWMALLKALENSQNMDDFTEYNHQDHLVEQICLSLAHLTSLLNQQDLILIKDVLEFNFDCFRDHTHKVLERILPEKSTVFFDAKHRVTALSQLALENNEKSTVKQLLVIFSQNIS